MSEPAKKSQAASETMLVPRSQLTGTLVSLLGWIVLIVPMLLISFIIFAAVTQPNSTVFAVTKIGLIVLGVALLFCMIAFPQLLGQAVIHRERDMYRAAIITGIPTAGVVIYLLIRWLSNL